MSESTTTAAGSGASNEVENLKDRSPATNNQKDITFSPPLDLGDDHETNNSMEIPPRGSFVRKTSTSLRSSGIEKVNGSIEKDGMGGESSSGGNNHGSSSQASLHVEIDFCPDGDVAMSTAIPRKGSYVEREKSPMKGQRVGETREINFSPGGSDLPTAPPPRTGSFVDRGLSPTTAVLVEKEINFSPGGSDLPTAAPPQRGSFVEKGSSPKRTEGAVFEEEASKSGRFDDAGSNPGATVDEQVSSSFSGIDLPTVTPTRRVSFDKEINFSPGGSDLPTAPPPNRGSFVEKGSSPSRAVVIEKEINFSPGGSDFVTGPPPRQGSFLGQSVSVQQPTCTTGQSASTNKEGKGEEVGILTDDQKLGKNKEHGKGLKNQGEKGKGLKIKGFLGQTKASNQRDPHPRVDDDSDPLAAFLKLENDVEDALNNILDSPKHMKRNYVDNHFAPDADEGKETGALTDSILKLGELLGSASNCQDKPQVDAQGDATAKRMWEAESLSEKNTPIRLSSDEPTTSIKNVEDKLLNESVDELKNNPDVTLKESTLLAESDYVPEDSIAKLEAFLDQALDDEEIPPSASVQEVEVKGEMKQELSESDVIEYLDAILTKPPSETVQLDDCMAQDEEDYKPEDSIAKLEAFLDKALDDEDGPAAEPMQKYEKVVEDSLLTVLNDDVQGRGNEAISEMRPDEPAAKEDVDDMPDDDSIARLDSFLDKALDDDIEVLHSYQNKNVERPSERKKEEKISTAKHAAKTGSTAKRLISRLTSGVDKQSKMAVRSSRPPKPRPTPKTMASKEEKTPIRLSRPPKPRPTPKTLPNKEKKPIIRSYRPIRNRPEPLSTTFEDTEKANTALKTSLNTTSQVSKKSPAAPKPARNLLKTTRIHLAKKPVSGFVRSGESLGKSPRSDSSFMSRTFASQSKERGKPQDDSVQQAAKKKKSGAKKIFSKITSWAKHSNSTPATKVPSTVDDAQKLNLSAKKDTTPSRSSNVFERISQPKQHSNTSPAAKVRSTVDDAPNANLSEKKCATPYSSSNVFQRLSQPKPEPPPPEVENFSTQLTKGAFALSPSPSYHTSTRSVGSVSLSSQCSVTHFESPMKLGKRGCQKKFNPYLFETRGPCELCVYFLSDEEKAKLDAEGRHIRVMFTSGGCCKSCDIFPGASEGPARLCRTCFFNSHRHVLDKIAPHRLNVRRKKGFMV